MPNAMQRSTPSIVAVWLAVAGFLGFLAHGLKVSGEFSEQRGREQTMAIARLVEKHTVSIFKLADLTLLDAIGHIPRADFDDARRLSAERRNRIAAVLREHQERLPGVVSISVTDAEGYVFANSVGAPPGTLLGDRPYFLELKAGLRDRPAISDALFGRVSKRWGVQVARRAERADGSFAGMVVANLGLDDTFINFYASLGLAEGSTISVRTPENRVLVRFPVIESMLGQTPKDSAANREVLKGEREGIVRSKSGIDGVERHVAYRRLANLPIVVRVGLPVAEAARQRFNDVFTAALVALSTVVGAVLLTVALRQRDRREAEIRDLNQNLEQRVRQRTEALERANRELETFSYSVSHDLRSPLRAINGYANVLLDEEGNRLDPESRRMLERIARNATRLGQLIDDILDYSRLGRTILTPGDVDMEALADAAAEQARLLYPAVGILRLPLPRARGDAIMLRQVWQNLIDNACKYSSAQPDARVEVGYDEAGGAYYVRDNGVGIDMRYADKLFGMFQRLHNDERFGGTGVGLAIVKRLIGRHGGDIRVDSSPGKGATFSFTLGQPAAES